MEVTILQLVGESQAKVAVFQVNNSKKVKTLFYRIWKKTKQKTPPKLISFTACQPLLG